MFTPKRMKALLENERRQHHFELVPAMSDAGRAMTRDVSEYLN